MARVPNKLDSDQETMQVERQRAGDAVRGLSTRAALIEYAARLKRYPHLIDLVDVCLDKCVEDYLVHGNAYKRRLPLDIDIERVDLHRAWLRMLAITNIGCMSLLSSVKVLGYLKVMLGQLENLDEFGTAEFAKLKRLHWVEYSTEYLMRKHYSDHLSSSQISKIDKLMIDSEMVI